MSEEKSVAEALEYIKPENGELLSKLSHERKLQVRHFLRDLWKQKIQENATYSKLNLSDADQADYAAVAMMMGLSKYMMPLPDFIVYLAQQGINGDELTARAVVVKNVIVASDACNIFSDADVKKYWDDRNLDNTRIPENNYQIDESLAARWIDKASSTLKKKARADFVKQIVYISFADFVTNLKICGDKFITAIKREPYTILLSILPYYRPYKSSEWLVALCKLFVPDFPRPTSIVMSPEELWPILAKGSGENCTYNLLLLDDISYSGTQVANAITHLASTWKKQNTTNKIVLHIILPVVSEIAQARILKTMSLARTDNFEIYLYLSAIYPSFSNETQAAFRYDLDDSNKSVMYAAHKLPDQVSVPATLFGPLISSCEKYYYTSDGKYAEFDTFEPPCPWPPYKRKDAQPEPLNQPRRFDADG